MSAWRHIATIAIAVAMAAGAGAQRIEFSHPSGLYADGLTLAIHTTTPSLTIRYTTNGSIPTQTSPRYTTPLVVGPGLFSKSNIFSLQNAPDDRWNPPDTVEHIVVIRAALFDDGGQRLSDVATGSYAIGDVARRLHDLPLLSVCVDSTDLFDFDSGIFVPGVAYDPTAPDPHRTGNYYYRGREWERPAHADLIVDDKLLIAQDCGIRTHGISQRNKMQKSTTLYAREEYGSKHFKAQVFDDRPYNKYKRLVLRTMQATEPHSSTGINDWICQQLAMQLRCDNLATRPVVVFLNGEYWGIQFLEEKPDEHYLKSLHGVDDETVDIINWWGHEAENGSAVVFNDMLQQLQYRDPTSSTDVAWVAEHVDIDALIDYMLLELFVRNSDWPDNNARCWSYQGSPWRWIFFDGDYSLGNRDIDVFANINYDRPEAHYPTSERATRVFRWVMQSDTIARRAALRLIELEHTVFAYHNTSRLIETVVAALTDELPHHTARFGTPHSNEQWLYEIHAIEQLLVAAPTWLTDAFINNYGIQVDVVPQRAPHYTLYPNPTKGIALFSYIADEERDVVLDIHNAAGQLLYQLPQHMVAGNNTILLPRLKPGTYIVSVEGEEPANKLIVRP